MNKKKCKTICNSVDDSVSNSVRNSVRDYVRDYVYNPVYNSARSSVINSVYNPVYNSARSSVYYSVYYFINEKILREFREVSSPVNIKEPTPYPKKIPSNFSSKQTSNNATFKKEINDLESKFKNLEKAYNKIMKKNNDVQDVLQSQHIGFVTNPV